MTAALTQLALSQNGISYIANSDFRSTGDSDFRSNSPSSGNSGSSNSNNVNSDAITLYPFEGNVEGQSQIAAEYLRTTLPDLIAQLRVAIPNTNFSRDYQITRFHAADGLSGLVTKLVNICEGWRSYQHVAGFTDAFIDKMKPALEDMREVFAEECMVELAMGDANSHQLAGRKRVTANINNDAQANINKLSTPNSDAWVAVFESRLPGALGPNAQNVAIRFVKDLYWNIKA